MHICDLAQVLAMHLKYLLVCRRNSWRVLILLALAVYGLHSPVLVRATDLDFYVNSVPEGFRGIIYNGFFYRSPAGGEYPRRCALLLNGYCFLATGNQVTRVSPEVISLTDRSSLLPIYLCRTSIDIPKPWGSCSAKGWIANPQ
jgi:hypothetical protein